MRTVAGPLLKLSAGQSSSMDSVTTPLLTQGFLGISESHAGSSVSLMPPLTQPVTNPSSMQGESASTQSYIGSSQASGVNIPATPVPGLQHYQYVCLCILTLITAPNAFPALPPQVVLDIELVMAAYNIFGFQSCALKVTCTVTCFITWSVT